MWKFIKGASEIKISAQNKFNHTISWCNGVQLSICKPHEEKKSLQRKKMAQKISK